jgi:signal transduction histidine kinase/DNA-binding LacI/PurR family transcriptional regulator/AraC-like DNA-binding protein
MARKIRDGRPTIGVLVGWQVYWTPTPYSYLNPIFHGICSAARRHDTNLLLACGMGSSADPADPPRPAWPSRSPDADFVPVGAWNTDGLIVINPLLSDSRSRYIHELMAAGHPVVFIGNGEGQPAIVADNAGGVAQAIRHLVEHGHERIAFIGGNPEDMDGDTGDRLRAYQSALRECGLGTTPDLIDYGIHTFAGGYAAMQRLLASQASFTAVLASNDESAAGAMRALKEAGRKIPQDVAMIGFDDRPEAVAQSPPLTSVHIPLYKTGYQALELMLQHVRGQADAAESVKVATRLAIRRSCGCRDGTRPVPARPVPPADASPVHPTTQVVQTMAEAVLAESQQFSTDEARALCGQMLAGFVRSVETREAADFGRAVDEILARADAGDDDVHIWQAAISVLRHEAPALAEGWSGDGAQRFALDMLDRARDAIGERMQQQHGRYAFDQKWTTNRIGMLTARLLTTLSEAEIFDVLAHHLPAMGIERTTLAFFEAQDDDPAGWSLLRTIPGPLEPPLRARTCEFPPQALHPPGRAFSLALLPLVSQAGSTGFVAFDTANIELYGAIAQQVAAALNSARLYAEATEGRKLAEEANRLKSRFLSTVSHELRTPLHLIVGLSEILLHKRGQGETSAPAAYRKDIQQIYASAQHLGWMIRDVLDLATSEAGQLRLTLERLNLSQTLQVAVEMGRRLVRDKGLAWRESLPPLGPYVLGDRTRLRQVVLNLLSNAVKFTSRGEVSLRVAVQSESVVVEVGDSGLGIPLHEQAAIFDEFRRSERTTALGYGGLGLGLAICRRLIEMHGGEIGVHSSGEPGQGATFYFTLPLAPLAREAGDAGPASDLAALGLPSSPAGLAQALELEGLGLVDGRGEKVILIVDDDTRTLEMYARILQTQSVPYRVLRAHNGQEALTLIQQDRPDLVLLDLMMPGLDGFGVMEAMQENEATRDIPVIVLTGQVLTEKQMARLNRRVATVLEKGLFSAEETLSHVEAVLARHRKLGGEAQRLVRRAMAYLHEHYAEPISREDLARHVGMSDDYLTACFRRELGMTPVTYLNRYRINLARALLTTTDRSVTEIALAVGFSDSGYFSRVFRREVGVSPDTFRRS